MKDYRRFCLHGAASSSISKIRAGASSRSKRSEELLRKREIGPLQGFRSKMGRPFAAILKIAKDDEGHFKMEFDFGKNDDEGDGEPVDFSGQSQVGTCPKCSGAVFEHGMKYVCENSVASPKTCDFATGRSSCSRKSAANRWASCSTMAGPIC
ncbi:topoisomerase C-terminal repeat-containing protein [Cupriavidus basilensis]